jgi:hypothetical protein
MTLWSRFSNPCNEESSFGELVHQAPGLEQAQKVIAQHTAALKPHGSEKTGEASPRSRKPWWRFWS